MRDLGTPGLLEVVWTLIISLSDSVCKINLSPYRNECWEVLSQFLKSALNELDLVLDISFPLSRYLLLLLTKRVFVLSRRPLRERALLSLSCL